MDISDKKGIPYISLAVQYIKSFFNYEISGIRAIIHIVIELIIGIVLVIILFNQTIKNIKGDSDNIGASVGFIIGLLIIIKTFFEINKYQKNSGIIKPFQIIPYN